MTSGFTAVYFFIYCVHFYATKLEIEGFVSTFLYFGYTFIMCFLFFLLTGNFLFLVIKYNIVSLNVTAMTSVCVSLRMQSSPNGTQLVFAECYQLSMLASCCKAV